MTLRRRQKIDEWACYVCLDYGASPDNMLVQCEGPCKMVVHQKCYGIEKVPADGVAWICDRCSSDVHRTARIKCSLCPIAGGALKPAEDGSWCHVICARFVPAVFLNDWRMSQISLTQVRKAQSLTQVRCSVCVRSGNYAQARIGVCIRCNNVDCSVTFHAYCAWSEELLVELDSAGGALEHSCSYVAYCTTHYSTAVKAHAQCGTLVRRYQYDSPLPSHQTGLPTSSISFGSSANESAAMSQHAEGLKPSDVKATIANSSPEHVKLPFPIVKRHTSSSNGVTCLKKRRLVTTIRLKQVVEPNITDVQGMSVTNKDLPDQSVQRSVQTVILRKIGRHWHRAGIESLDKKAAESPQMANKQDCHQMIKENIDVVADVKINDIAPTDEATVTSSTPVASSVTEFEFPQRSEVVTESSTLSNHPFNGNPLLYCARPLDTSDSISLLPYLPTAMLHPYIPVSLYENWKNDQSSMTAVPFVTLNSSYSIPSDTYCTTQQRVPDGAYYQDDSLQMPSSSTRCSLALDSSASLDIIHNDDELLAKLDALITSGCDWDTLYAHEFVIAKSFFERVLTDYDHDADYDPTASDWYDQRLQSNGLHTEGQHVRLTFYEFLSFLKKKDELSDLLYRESKRLDQQYRELCEEEAMIRFKLLRPFRYMNLLCDELDSPNV